MDPSVYPDLTKQSQGKVLLLWNQLETLYLADNQMSQEDNYQEMLMTAVPSLNQIDGNVLRRGMPFHHQRTAGIH